MATLLRLLLVLVLAMRCAPVLADSASLFAQAQSSDPTRYTGAISKGASFAYTSDNRSFYGWWQPAKWTPSAGVIVALHGTGGYATSELYLWLPYAETRGHAVLTLSWWFGSGDSTADYYTPSEMYPLLSGILKAKGVGSGQALFTGFSRGSANSYAVAALDYASTGQRHFGLVLSNAGGAAVDYPPNKEIRRFPAAFIPMVRKFWLSPQNAKVE